MNKYMIDKHLEIERGVVACMRHAQFPQSEGREYVKAEYFMDVQLRKAVEVLLAYLQEAPEEMWGGGDADMRMLMRDGGLTAMEYVDIGVDHPAYLVRRGQALVENYLWREIDRVVRDGGEMNGLDRLMAIRRALDELYDAEVRVHQKTDPYEAEILALDKPREIVDFGLKSIDERVGGIEQGDVVVLAARTSVGKTAFMVSSALAQVLRQKKRVAVVSFEMTAQKLIRRCACNVSNVSIEAVRTRRWTSAERASWERAVRLLAAQPLRFFNFGGRNVLQLVMSLKGMDVDVVWIDYVQQIGSGERRGTENEHITVVSKAIMQHAKSTNQRIVLLSQFSRDVEKEKREPVLTDLRGSGSLEQDADVVMMLHREDAREQVQPVSEVQVIIGKNREGVVGKLRESLKFDKPKSLFYDAEDMVEEYARRNRQEVLNW